MGKAMSLKDIEKLKERVDKDPNSKLFVPLAEEYKKEGMIEEAIGVLLNGIERQPGYMSARVSLGKIYLEKGMMNEARSEFESVIKSIPDNLYAHKKLAEIYRDLGEKTLAAKSYRAVLSLNALDDDAISNLRDLEKADKEEKELVDTGGEATGATDTTLPPLFHEDISLPAQEEVIQKNEITSARQMEEDLSAFKDSIFADKTPQTMHSYEAESEAAEVVETAEVGEEEVSEEEVSFADISEAVVAESPQLATIPEEKGQEGAFAGYGAEEMAEIIFPEPASGISIEAADNFIADGNYLEAMNVYRKMLSATPENKAVLQRAEELKTLLKLMGKDKEALIAKMDAFLAGINKRRNEFYRSS
ncbi:hypothetical protein NBG4_970010 [Candidatus Sulfobium mesophilum]|uniref:Tetratricopeptide repeat protein n=1 Tax=Candidatus Sulfobium mesophilum TaxID=2016548 RepID=A0A2U3QLA2_9BACT|nr:hypothetical protein NBG4_970010 [Candidatus Sulfobium mesophilum]